MRARSLASVKSTGVWNDAATVWPCCTLRSSTMPSIGERTSALSSEVWCNRTRAVAFSTSALALATEATARSVVGLGGLEVLGRDDAARGQGLRTVAPFARLVHRRFVGGDARLGRVQRRLGLRELRADLIGVDDREHLPLRDAIVEIDGDAIDAAGNFGADIHLILGLQRSGGADSHHERTAHDLGGDVGRRGAAAKEHRTRHRPAASDDHKSGERDQAAPTALRRRKPQAIQDLGVGQARLLVHGSARTFATADGASPYAWPLRQRIVQTLETALEQTSQHPPFVSREVPKASAPRPLQEPHGTAFAPRCPPRVNSAGRMRPCESWARRMTQPLASRPASTSPMA